MFNVTKRCYGFNVGSSVSPSGELLEYEHIRISAHNYDRAEMDALVYAVKKFSKNAGQVYAVHVFTRVEEE